VGFFIGILMLYQQTGTLNLYTAEGTGALQQAGSLATLTGWWGCCCSSYTHRTTAPTSMADTSL